MSRVGNRPLSVPDKVEVKIQDGATVVKGPKGSLQVPVPSGISVAVKDKLVTVSRGDDEKPTRAKHGMLRRLLENAVIGVTAGYERKLEIIGVGYRAKTGGRELELSVGYSHLVKLEIPQGIDAAVEKNTTIILKGIDKAQLGQFAADIRGVRPPEVYKGKGIRYEGEYVRKKAGKAAGAGAK